MAYPSPASSLPPKRSEIEIESECESQAPPYYPPSANDFEASTSTSTSTAAVTNKNSSKNYGHDVFINHRGPDVKKTFASHLHRRLGLHGVQAFLDYQDMQEGENITAQIKDAIATATVHVAIFSPGYADSSWCLDELIDMWESKNSIIPVFYKVKPADLRWTESRNGVYSEALRNLQNKTMRDPVTHEEKPRHNCNTIENWRKALARVSEISGFELDACNGDEGELLDKVVECLLKKVKKEGLFVARYPTGLNEKLKHFEYFLSQLPKDKPKVVGIVGLGGIGKSTLAKEHFNRKRSYYDTSFFLADVRNAAKSGESSLVGLQRKLLNILPGVNNLIDSIDEGKGKLIRRLPLFFQGLLIVDDVDHMDQLDALLPGEIKDTLPTNCLILITSRDKFVLLRSGIPDSSIYKLSGLSTQHSKELFCHHAFRQPHPLPDFQYLVDNILRVCNGLPLSLEVLGRHFRGNIDETYWEAELNRLHVHPDIQQTLRISYDSLVEEEKHIFLDIACFLIGEKRDTAIKMWDKSGSKGFQNLQNKSLVEVDGENCIHMHDHLKELGREMAEKSGLRIPRLWDRTERVDIAPLKQSSNHNVRGIRMVPSADVGIDEFKCYASLRSDMPWFKRRIHELLGNRAMKLCKRQLNTLYPGITMSNLQLLVTEDLLLERILRTSRLPNLKWLRWYKCGHSWLPFWIPMENLRVLQVVGGALKILWQGKAQAPLQLLELEIWAPLSKIPKSIGELRHLEQIHISLPDDNDMRSLPEEFCELSSLKRFELINAWKMKSLPDSIGNLRNLEHLTLSFSRSLERLPNSFEDLSRLKYLDLRGSDNLIISTKTHGNIPSLDFFNFHGRSGGRSGKVQLSPLQLPRSLQELHIAVLPSTIENLCNLEVLELENSLLQMLPPSLSDLRNLKELRLVDCRRLKCLPDSLGLLTVLEVKSGHGLVEVGTLPRTLIQLNLISCFNLEKIDGLCGLAKLQMLNISGWRKVEELAGIETLVSLEELRASRCIMLKRIRGLGQLTKLRLLDVHRCLHIQELEGVEHLRSLEKLDASDCPGLHWDGRVLEQLPRLLKEGMLYI